LYLAANQGATPGEVSQAVVANATVGKVTSAGSGSPNRLLHSLFTSTAPGTEPGTEPDPSNQAPTAVVAKTGCAGDTCSFSAAGSNDPDGDAITYSWNGGAGTGIAYSASFSKGTHTVTLTVSDGVASDSASTTVTCDTTGKGRNKVTTCS
ncbi:MAG: PKD domain-containing protein, partial [Actinomycetota bacterium]